MIAVSFYDAQTGIFNGNHLVLSDEALIALNTPAGHLPMPGHFDSQTCRVDVEAARVLDEEGKELPRDRSYIVDYTPPAPSTDYELVNKRWQFKPDVVERIGAHDRAVARIAQLEAMQPRILRELALGHGDALARLQVIEDQITVLRKDILKT